MTIETHILAILKELGITDPEVLKNTPKRWGSWLRDYTPHKEVEPRITTFPNPGYDEMVYDRCEFYSLCEHHFLPVAGVAHIAYIPDTLQLGLSKLSRIVDYIAKRPSTQENLTNQIAEYLSKKAATPDVAVLLEARHMCKSMRGVTKQTGKMITTHLGGRFKDSAPRSEFLGYTERSS